MVSTEGGRADWSRLTEYLSAQAGGQVTLSWTEFGRIVGGVPASATRHYPQWWHGDRSHARAWLAAGYTLGGVEPGRSVTFRRDGSPPTAGRITTPRQRTPAAVGESPAGSASRLLEIDPHRAMLIIQCSGAKQPGGSPAEASGIEPWPEALIQARRRVLDAAGADESGLLPAWRRYSSGHFYTEAGLTLRQAVDGGNVLILSGGYGLLHADEPIGNYNKIFKLRDWPRGLLERLLVEHVRTSDALAVVAFASTSSDYARLLRRTPWWEAGMTVVLVTVTGITGGAMGEVPRRLGQAFDCFWSRRPADRYPAGITVEPLA
jgi:hypothetical protein